MKNARKYIQNVDNDIEDARDKAGDASRKANDVIDEYNRSGARRLLMPNAAAAGLRRIRPPRRFLPGPSSPGGGSSAKRPTSRSPTRRPNCP